MKMYILGICTALAVTAGCSTTNTSTAANSLIQHDAEMKDVARCGGLGVDDRVGLTIAAEKDKYGGELSAERASEIRIDAMRNGLLTGDDKKYQAYVQCILELDKRRASNLSSAERLEQPFIKVQLSRPSAQANRAMLSVDNTGGELTELSVRPLTFLYIGELRMAGTPQAASDSPLRAVYVPVVGDYEGFEAFPAEYKGRLYETFTMDERKFDGNVAAFANSLLSITKTSLIRTITESLKSRRVSMNSTRLRRLGLLARMAIRLKAVCILTRVMWMRPPLQKFGRMQHRHALQQRRGERRFDWVC
jgi:hypothetical protein